MKEFDLKCNEVESYKQRCESLEHNLRRLCQEVDQGEEERVSIIESYERKVSEMKLALNE